VPKGGADRRGSPSTGTSLSRLLIEAWRSLGPLPVSVFDPLSAEQGEVECEARSFQRMERIWRRRPGYFGRYLFSATVFWFLSLVVFGGGSATLHIAPLAPILNIVLVALLWRGSQLARLVLMVDLCSLTLFMGSGGVPSVEEPFPLLVPLLIYQIFVLWRLGQTRTPEMRIAQTARG
jgi:hypothetical protein